jgi:hypothetical protein
MYPCKNVVCVCACVCLCLSVCLSVFVFIFVCTGICILSFVCDLNTYFRRCNRLCHNLSIDFAAGIYRHLPSSV